MTELSLITAHGPLQRPTFFPDATRAVVRTVDAQDLEACGIQGLVVNTLHLSSHPGTSLVESLGGVHRFMNWERPIVSDSGGFQVFSLISENSDLGTISKKGFTYRLEKGHEKKTLTPEKCIQKQFHLGSDILFCLDHCTHPEAPAELQRQSVEHTVLWARLCREEFERRVQRWPQEKSRPLLFAIVQGGNDPALRKECAERLQEIGFDGYGYGGWPINEAGGLVEMVAYVAELLPGFPKHGLGIGKPENLVAAFRAGYHLFDCTLPTRDARHKRLYLFREKPCAPLKADFYHYLYIEDERYARDGRPLEEGCNCPCCLRYSRAYLHHLFKINDGLALRLATLHNLRFYTRLTECLGLEVEGTEGFRPL